jgi:S1-C subfamily serine protease
MKGSKGIALAEKYYRSSAAQNNQSAIHNLLVMRKLGYLKETDLVTPTANGMLSSVLERALPLEPASLRATGGFAAQETQPGSEFLEGKESVASLHSRFAGSVAEIIGDVQYGSGTIVGEMKIHSGSGALFYNNKPEGSLVEFFAESKQNVRSDFEYLIVATNAHVAEENTSLKIGLGADIQGSSVLKADVHGVCFSDTEDEDLALLFVPQTESVKKLNLRKFFLPPVSIVPAGTRVFTLANPRQLPRTISQGIVSANRPEGIQFDASISTGSSGGALLTEKGELVGTIVGYIGSAGDQNLNFAIPSSKLVRMLEGNNIQCEWLR